ncbi:A/G-specific adenine glycosylase [Belliella kenyensis]|uniref:Adenine DNA glycosylase n=1 Tax=Belliella kenyensis TaxID=1472724 RepID=A0ABV8EJ02_9BACT|nr:A/G-specific adenine glycosylase [Belliella kenyensis]MCH7401436.1 A/G-specific adenine glycosylase [Belliella kenyensis]MDN3602879.1 A/G-specific adenine glycosylase [Belliella kenyensis]
MKNRHFASILLNWYTTHKRDLPWRNTHNPYIIWLSEIILQQTRVAQGLPYFEIFLEKYPKVSDLASAPSDEVMRLWQGLGYYSRARNLHQCAKDIMKFHNGEFPKSYQELIKLKGVGSYTAAAIASFAFGETVAVVDGNVFRVLGRYFGLSEDISSGSGKRAFESLANEQISLENPAEYNQAIMEFGALHCTPKNPACTSCPLQAGCFAFKENLVQELPIKLGKVKVKTRYFNYLYIKCGTQVIVRQRQSGDIWQGLYDFPLEETENTLIKVIEDFAFFRQFESIIEKIEFDPESTFKHILTHQRIFANFVTFVIKEDFLSKIDQWVNDSSMELVNVEKLETLGKPKLILNFLTDEK